MTLEGCKLQWKCYVLKYVHVAADFAVLHKRRLLNFLCNLFFTFPLCSKLQEGVGGVLFVQVFCAIGFTIAIIVFSAGRQGSHVHVTEPKDPGEGTLG